MTLAGWLAAMAVGLLAGRMSALTGIGGGVIVVPFLYFFLSQPELSGAHPPNETAVVAHAANLLVMVPISAHGTWLYHRAGLVDWRSASWLGALLAVPLWTRFQQKLPAQALHWLFAGLFVSLGARIILVNLTDLLRR